MKIINATATIQQNGQQPFIDINDGPDNSGTFNLTLNDPTTGTTLSTLAHLADSFDDAQTKFFLTLPIAQLHGKVVVCTGVLKRVPGTAGPLIFQLRVEQEGFPANAPTAEVSVPTVDLQNLAFRVELRVV